MNKKFINQLVVILTTAFIFSACTSEVDKTEAMAEEAVSKLESAMSDLQNKYDELRAGKPGSAMNWAADDLKSIGDWEYKVIEFSSLSSRELEDELNALGKERWQVFWLKENSNDNMQVMLKRTTVSYLSKLPLSSLGKIVLDGNQ